jgi:hypothetical protein
MKTDCAVAGAREVTVSGNSTVATVRRILLSFVFNETTLFEFSWKVAYGYAMKRRNAIHR